MDNTALNTNTLAFIALCNEYCVAMGQARESEREAFVQSMLRLLPRIYISATDLKTDFDPSDEAYLESTLEEDYYESVRCSVENLLPHALRDPHHRLHPGRRPGGRPHHADPRLPQDQVGGLRDGGVPDAQLHHPGRVAPVFEP